MPKVASVFLPIIRYIDYIGYRYCENKRIESAPIIEYLKIKYENIKDDDIYNEFNNLLNGNVSVGIKYIKQIL